MYGCLGNLCPYFLKNFLAAQFSRKSILSSSSSSDCLSGAVMSSIQSEALLVQCSDCFSSATAITMTDEPPKSFTLECDIGLQNWNTRTFAFEGSAKLLHRSDQSS